MIPTKIDWTRPLRTTDGHDQAVVYAINPESVLPISIHVPATGWRGDVDREGYGREATSVPLVENVPPEPRIVERFGLAYRPCGEYALAAGYGLFETRKEAEAIARQTIHCVARVLIEEPGQ